MVMEVPDCFSHVAGTVHGDSGWTCIGGCIGGWVGGVEKLKRVGEQGSFLSLTVSASQVSDPL